MDQTKNLHVSNVVSAPGTTLAGLAAAAPALVDIIGNLTFPSSAVEWVQLVFGVLAVFARL